MNYPKFIVIKIIIVIRVIHKKYSFINFVHYISPIFVAHKKIQGKLVPPVIDWVRNS